MYPINYPPPPPPLLSAVLSQGICMVLHLCPNPHPLPCPCLTRHYFPTWTFPGSRCASSAHNFLPGLLMPLPRSNNIVVPTKMPLSACYWASPLLSHVSTTDISSYLQPHSRFTTCRPPGVVSGPPTVLTLASGGLCTWPQTTYPPPISLPRPLVSPMTQWPDVSPAYPWYGVGTPYGWYPQYLSSCTTATRTPIQTTGPPVSPPCRKIMIPGCRPLPLQQFSQPAP